MSLFAEIDFLKAELDALRPLSPEQEARILQKFRLEWNYNSNAIEGNSLTLGETRSLLLHGLTAAGKPMRDHLDIKGHNEAVLWLEDMVRDERPLTEQFIRGMHEVLLGEAYDVPAQTADGQSTRKRIIPGQYKQLPNNVLTATGEMFYFASPEETQAMMTDLVDWYRQELTHSTLHPVALAAEFHYRFVRIHPFDDGNGRMSRLLMNLILLRGGYPMTIIRQDDRNRYLAALSEADAGEFEPFLRFIVENVEASLHLMVRAAKGESIDEPDDLDKKLALLKKQLASREDFGKATWNLTTQTRFYKNVLKFWLEDLGQEMLRFNDLFITTTVRFEASDSNRGSFSGSGRADLATALELANRFFNNGERLIEEATLLFEWNKFRLLALPFDQGLRIHFKFDQYRYQANFSVYERQNNGYSYSPEQIADATYITPLDLDFIHSLNHELANKIYAFINTKLDKLDSAEV